MKYIFQGETKIPKAEFDPEKFFSMGNPNVKFSRDPQRTYSSPCFSKINKYKRGLQKTEEKKIYIYKFIYEGTCFSSREILRILGDQTAGNISLVDICFLLSRQANKEMGALNAEGCQNLFFIWDDDNFCMTKAILSWDKAEPSYIDRHSGFPYIETPSTPAGWYLGLYDDLKSKYHEDVIVFSTNPIKEH